MRTRRSFTPSFKAKVVLSILTGEESSGEVCRKHGIKSQLLTKWKRTFAERAERAFEGDLEHSEDKTRIAELERLVGRLTLDLEVQKKVLSMLG